MKDFRELSVWRKAHQLTLDVYQRTKGFPRDEVYGLTGQLRRSAASVAANLAEGCGRASDADFARLCCIAMGSASELEYHHLLAKDLGILSPTDHTELDTQTTEVKRMLTALIQRLRK